MDLKRTGIVVSENLTKYSRNLPKLSLNHMNGLNRENLHENKGKSYLLNVSKLKMFFYFFS